MPGDGTYEMGGVDGKDWGLYESAGGSGPGPCTWSIRAVRRYDAAEELASGETPPGEKVSVDIEPDGGVGVWDGMIGDHRIVFVTNNCGAWQVKN